MSGLISHPCERIHNVQTIHEDSRLCKDFIPQNCQQLIPPVRNKREKYLIFHIALHTLAIFFHFIKCSLIIKLMKYLLQRRGTQLVWQHLFRDWTVIFWVRTLLQKYLLYSVINEDHKPFYDYYYIFFKLIKIQGEICMVRFL